MVGNLIENHEMLNLFIKDYDHVVLSAHINEGHLKDITRLVGNSSFCSWELRHVLADNYEVDTFIYITCREVIMDPRVLDSGYKYCPFCGRQIDQHT